MRLRMDELGPQHVGKRITWWVMDGDETAPRYVPTTRTLRSAKVIARTTPAPPASDYPDGVVVLVCEPVVYPRMGPGPFWVGAHWPVEVEDGA